jgi:hypothetical protein
MADTKTSALVALAGASVAATDKLPIFDASATELKNIEVDDLGTALAAVGGLATSSSVTSAVSAHEADTTSVHGISNTANLITTTTLPVALVIAASDETTALTTGTAKATFRMPFAMTLTAVRASLTTASSSGTPTIDINENGSTILSTKLTIDASEKTSTTAAAAAVISDTALADDAEITIDIDVAGTGAAGLKVTLIGTKA